MNVIIPMSGQGKRFVEAGYADPKPLIEVDGAPIIKHIIDLFPGASVQCICNSEHLATTPMRSIIEGYGARVHSIPSHSLGPVYAVAQIFDSIPDDEQVVVSYCDYGTVWDYDAFRALCESGKYDGIIASYRGFHPHMLGTDNYAFMRTGGDDGKSVLEIREKEPFTADRMSEYASNGTYYFKTGALLKKYFRQLLNAGINKNGEYYVSLVYNLLIADGLHVGVFEIDKMLQWGTPRDLETYKMWSRHFSSTVVPCKSTATLILPMAGAGSRFKMVGYSDPKPLLPVDGAPMIVRAVESLPACDRNVFVSLNEHLNSYKISDAITSRFPNTTIIGIDKTTEGQACTSAIAIREGDVAAETPILISACDNGVDYDAEAYMRLEADPSVDVIVWSFDNNPTSQLYPHMYAWLDVDADNNIKHVSVKKHFAGAKHAIIGTMFFRSARLFNEGYEHIIKNNIRTNGEFYVDDLLNPLIAAGYKVKLFPTEAYICWGTPNDYKTYLYWASHFRK